MKTNIKKIAFIGLGNMGLPMANNLSKSGYDVIGYDITPPKAAKFKLAKTIGEACENAKCIITMLPEGRHVQNVFNSICKSICKNAAKNILYIDCSTIDVKTSKKIHTKAKQLKLHSLDAPVSGGIMGAKNSTLAFMVGGEKSTYKKAKPILEKMGAKIIYCGKGGSGQIAKMCNNMVLAITMIGTSEAFALAKKLGLDKQSLYDVLSVSSGQSWSTTTYCPVPGPVPTSPANKNYKPGFMVDLMKKDLTLSQLAAKEAKAKTPLGKMALTLYKNFAKKGNGKLDFSAIIKECQ